MKEINLEYKDAYLEMVANIENNDKEFILKFNKIQKETDVLKEKIELSVSEKFKWTEVYKESLKNIKEAKEFRKELDREYVVLKQQNGCVIPKIWDLILEFLKNLFNI